MSQVCQIKEMTAKIAVTNCGRETTRSRQDITIWASDVTCEFCKNHVHQRSDIDDHRDSLASLLETQ